MLEEDCPAFSLSQAFSSMQRSPHCRFDLLSRLSNLLKAAVAVTQMAAQMKQLEQKLMGLRNELREKEGKARQAEGTVQDLRLQLEDLQVPSLPT